MNAIAFNYDPDGRVVEQTETAPGPAVLNDEFYQYDNMGNVVTDVDLTGNLEVNEVFNSYNDNRQLTNAAIVEAQLFSLNAATQSFVFGGHAYTINVAVSENFQNPFMDTYQQDSYDNDGNVSAVQAWDWGAVDSGTQATVTSESGATSGLTVSPVMVSYSYALDDQVINETRYDGPVNATAGFAWTAGPTTNYAYDPAGRLAAAITTAGTTTVAAYNYTTYDHDDRLLSNTYSPETGLSGGGTYTYTYEADGALITAANPVGSSRSYVYDANGNRAKTAVGSSTSTYTAALNNEVLNDGTYAYTYDSEGNRTKQTKTGTTLSYTWDDDNRMTQALVGSTTITYDYDSNGRRTGSASGSNVVSYQYDGSALVMTLSSSGAYETYLLDPLGGSAPLAQQDNGGNVTWLIADQNGSVQDVVTNGGSTTGTDGDHVAFDSYGNKIVADTGTQSLFGFQGMVQAGVTDLSLNAFGLYYDNARWYSTQTGDFLSRDPSGFSAGDPNLYRFVRNDPVLNTDPTGLLENSTSVVGFSAQYGGSTVADAMPVFNVGYSASSPEFGLTSTNISNNGNSVSDYIQSAVSQQDLFGSSISEAISSNWGAASGLSDVVQNFNQSFPQESAPLAAAPAPAFQDGLMPFVAPSSGDFFSGINGLASGFNPNSAPPLEVSSTTGGGNDYTSHAAQNFLKFERAQDKSFYNSAVGLITNFPNSNDPRQMLAGVLNQQEVFQSTMSSLLSGDPDRMGTAAGSVEFLLIGALLGDEGAPAGKVGAVRPYEVGTADGLLERSAAGDNIAIHHVGQAYPMEQLVPGYNRATGPTIALPTEEHLQIPNLRGPIDLTPRQVLANDVLNLRNYTNAPNSSLQELIRLNKQTYPGAFGK